MAPPFGFSIGDFIAVANLTQIVDGLNGSYGIQTLCTTLTSLQKSLQILSPVFLDLLFRESGSNNSRPTRSPDPAVVNGIKHELGCCTKLMNDFLEASRKYTVGANRDCAGISVNGCCCRKAFSLPNLRGASRMNGEIRGNN
ncbi:hypothetical protein BDD12DRAFT_802570 [Trichophaea hybrida]|nr:hypothetical protein BDD12DRAFT_802570 [Trichophaea hybrida]